MLGREMGVYRIQKTAVVMSVRSSPNADPPGLFNVSEERQNGNS